MPPTRRPALPLAALLICLAAGVVAVPEAAAQRATFPAPPPHGTFHLDEAGVLGAAEAAEIDRIAGALLDEHDVAILAVVVRDLAARGAAGYTIERYAAELFDGWGIGSQARNHGMLLLVSVGDRAARIELGADWGGRHDDEAAYVMESLIVPEFRDGGYAEGLLAGVRGMDAMARGLALPSPRRPAWVLPASLGFALLVGGVVFSLFHSGRHGWAWMVLLGLGALLLFLSRNVHMGGGRGGGGGGGAFRGGSSGGGGATGRW